MSLPRGADFQPPRLLRNGHVQTMLSSSSLRRLLLRPLARKVNGNSEDVRFTLSDGVRLTGAITRQKMRDKARGLAVVYHGWEGSIDSSYVLQTGASLLDAGWDVFRLNFRDHGDTHHLNVGLFHSCLIHEVVEATAEAVARFRNPGAPVALAGFSLGGNFALRVALRAPSANLPLAHTIAICPVIDPHAGLFSLETAPWMYEWYFMHKWRGSLKRKQKLYPQQDYFTNEDLRQGLRGLTRVQVERHTEFGTLDAYLDGYSVSGERLAELKVPTTILTAEDDPVIPVNEFRELTLPPEVELDIAPYGGHCSFIQNWKLRSFTDDYITARFNAAAERTERF
ncbi:alpha/beta fold hydrolase [Oleiagrimonas sp. MCCC 1A03011]|uniref:YheT family hydrolase n=1 Tax=Oleiagrimonas sp. MCCC 1A03011 TaxID=1926883 RepID=UPI000DC56C4E|nr:alpha/beta fold hydrolase [Oleiagrimonas sp. MCCC 1A03011]RAP57085.1 alpha/beta hydrolase [Oleiagrimonas sp. MCCC 1A03011]